MRDFTISCVAVLLAVTMSPAAAQYSVLEHYDGTAELPDDVAFKHFITALAHEREHAKNNSRRSIEDLMVARALGLKPTADNALPLQRMGDFFVSLHDEVAEDIARSKRNQICEIAASAASQREAFEAIDNVDVLVRNRWRQAYEQTLESLNQENRDAFLNEIARSKMSISYTRVTAESYASTRNVNSYELTRTLCEAAQSELSKLGD